MRLILSALTATLMLAGCGSPALLTSAPQDKAVSAQAVSKTVQAKAEKVLEEAYPAYSGLSKSPFRNVPVARAGVSPVAKAKAGLESVTLTATEKADVFGFQGLARTRGEDGIDTRYVVKGKLNLTQGATSGVTMTWLPR
jgi:hypothetical protein